MKNLSKIFNILFLFFVVSYAYSQTKPALYPKMENGKYGFYNQSGTRAIENIYDAALGFNEGVAAVKKGGKWGYIDEAGNKVIDFVYEDAWYFTQGLAAVRKDGKWGYIDKSGNVKINFIYDDAADFSEDLAWVVKNKKVGFIDKTGNTVIDFQYGAATSFEDGLAGVQKNEKWGFIDNTGKVVIDFKFDEAKCFDNEIAPVKMINKWGFIDKKGRILIDYTYDKINPEYRDASFGWTYAEAAYNLANNNLNNPQEKEFYFNHLNKAIKLIQAKDTYLDSYDYEKLLKYYKLLGDEEKVALAKKRISEIRSSYSSSSYSDRDFSVDLSFGVGPLKYLFTGGDLLPIEGQLRINRLIITVLYTGYENYKDKWRFGAWMGGDKQEDVSNTYSGYDISVALKYAGGDNSISKSKLGYGHTDAAFGADFRYSKYNFVETYARVTNDLTGWDLGIRRLNPLVQRYDLSYIVGYNYSQVPFFFDFNFSMGLGYITIDLNDIDLENYTIDDERFIKEKWTGIGQFYIPIRIGFRVGFTIL